MDTDHADLHRLSLLIQRMLDADVLCEAEGAPLLAAAEAAGRSLKVRDAEAARRHIAHIALVTEALVQTNRLNHSDGRAVVETARRILAGDAD